jgi:hypothetical protein
MFWKKVEGLALLPLSSKVALTLFLCIAGIGYLLGFLNIYLTYNHMDGKPGLSVEDIRIAFSGSGGATAMERAVDTTMKQYFAGDGEYDKVKRWLTAGATEADFGSVTGILESSCLGCHSTDAKAGGVALQTYAEVSAVLKKDTGMSVSRLVSLSHTHVLATVSLLFLLCLVFSFTSFAESTKTIVMAFSLGSVVADIGSWWLAKLVAALAPLVILGGVVLAISFLALVLLPLYDLWVRKVGEHSAVSSGS